MPDAPTTERGTAVASPFSWNGVLPWSQFMDEAERSPDLQWPRSIQQFDQMRNDAQCQGLYLGGTAALRRYGWYIDPNECDPFYVGLLAADMNLVVGEDEARAALQQGSKGARLRSSHRFSWYNHLAMLLRALYYGHFYFEQVGEIAPDGPNGEEVWRLRKLGPRHPRTITEIKVADDGGLVSITQGYGSAGQPPPEIPVDRLVAYVWDQDPGNWVGRSIFRPMYRNWLIKDRLLRVDAIKHERNGVGMPVVEAPPGATKVDIQELDQMAQEYKAGERGGGAVPAGTHLRLVGTEGSIPDTIGSIRFQNEEMAKSMLMMFMQLGQTETGSRALGQTFVDWFQEQQTYIADWVVGVTTEHVIEDWWDWNVDPTTDRTPRLGYVTDAQSAPMPQDFAGAQLPEEVAAGLRAPRRPPIRAADDLGGLPGGHSTPSTNPAPTQALRLPARKLHRQPYAHEARAGTDFEGMEEDNEAAEDKAQKAWDDEKRDLMAWIAENIAAAKEAAAATAAIYNLSAEAKDKAFSKAGDAARSEAVKDASRTAKERVKWELLNQGVKRAAIITGLLIASPLDEALIIAAASGTALRATLLAGAERLTSRLQAGADSTKLLAEQVHDEIMGRKDPWAVDQNRGMIQESTNRTRLDVFGAVEDDEPGSLDLYASELLDINTCPACAYIDGQQLTRTQANTWYSGGGYVQCDGGPRCRGTVVAVYKGERGY
jgi:hypothetical protein